MKVAVIGAGWAGCAAAVEATRLGHSVTLFESARVAGGRARRVDSSFNGQPLALDNGQHILIGAYSETLRLMQTLGVAPGSSLLRLPLRLQFPNGEGLALPRSAVFAAWPGGPRWPAAWQAAWGIAMARGWSWGDKASLLRLALRWRAAGFACAPSLSVAALCKGLSPRAMRELVEPLCVSALNTPAERACAQVFLRVLKDALFSQPGGADLLLPRLDLSALLPKAALAWLAARGPAPRLGARVQALTHCATGWQLSTSGSAGADDAEQRQSESFDAVLLACPPQEAARLAACTGFDAGWAAQATRLEHESIATVYARLSLPPAHANSLAQPMLALHGSADAPAQFVFDRGQLGGPAGLLAFVVSASVGDKALLSAQVLAQGQAQLGLELELVQTIVEKRATFACTPGLLRPAAQIAPGLLACGDYVAGPYPATLEGAVRSGLHAARLLGNPDL
jgi:squalene-associated FAD-dependent desaturase